VIVRLLGAHLDRSHQAHLDALVKRAHAQSAPGANPEHNAFLADGRGEPRKRSACYAHASQAPDRFYALQERVTRMRGLESGHKQAEGYIRHVQSPDFALPMAS